jgi:hypothetical protein
MISNLFKKKNWDKPFSEKVAKRISKIAMADLPSWAEQAIYETNRSLMAYEKDKNKVHLEDALLGAEVIHAIVYEMNKRSVL